ncbi:hypothetical protein IFM89_016016, partial [Coptis chinensis]
VFGALEGVSELMFRKGLMLKEIFLKNNRMCTLPHLQEKVATVTEFLEKVTITHVLDKMQYLHAALSEALRLHHPVPTTYAIGPMKYIWGKDAEKYRPERWIDEDGWCHIETFQVHSLPVGPPMCAGKEFAYSQMKVFTSIMLNLFGFKLWEKKKPINYQTMITLHIDGPLKLRASPKV